MRWREMSTSARSSRLRPSRRDRTAATRRRLSSSRCGESCTLQEASNSMAIQDSERGVSIEAFGHRIDA